jgi:hypothetical protein
MRPRFIIRDLLWLTALIAMGLGWFMDHRRLADQNLSHNNVVYYTRWANPNAVVSALRSTFAGSTQVRFSADPQKKAIFIAGSTDQQEAALSAIISRLDKEPQQPTTRSPPIQTH